MPQTENASPEATIPHLREKQEHVVQHTTADRAGDNQRNQGTDCHPGIVRRTSEHLRRRVMYDQRKQAI